MNHSSLRYVLENIKKVAYSLLEKSTKRTTTILGIGFALLIIAFFAKNYYLIEIPKQGGSVTEAFVGSPRFINPVLALSQTDKDLVELLYASPITINERGDIIYELADNVTESQDGTEYILTLNPGAVFHDGTPITAQDVLFTVETIQDPVIGSPDRADWLGVKAEVVSEYEVLFELEKAYPNFVINNLTTGIIPSHIWSNISVEEFPFSTQNIHPIGSGPFQLGEVQRADTERITAARLTAFRDSVFSPYLDHIDITFVDSPADQLGLYERGETDSLGGVTPSVLTALNLSGSTVRDYLLPRMFTIFYNQTQNQALQQKEVRLVIDTLIDRDALVSDVFAGYAQQAATPLPQTSPYALGYESPTQERSELVQSAVQTLQKNSWSLDEETGIWSKRVGTETLELKFSLDVPETDDLVIAANKIRSNLAEANIPVTVVYHDSETLTQDIVRKRDFELLLFGYVTDIPADLYPFWHASGKNDPGLNIAQYDSITVDRALEKIRDGITNTEELAKQYTLIQEQITSDIPASFLFTPKYIYVARGSLLFGRPLGSIAYPEDRFRNVTSWYVKTERVLPWFIN